MKDKYSEQFESEMRKYSDRGDVVNRKANMKAFLQVECGKIFDDITSAHPAMSEFNVDVAKEIVDRVWEVNTRFISQFGPDASDRKIASLFIGVLNVQFSFFAQMRPTGGSTGLVLLARALGLSQEEIDELLSESKK